MRSNPMSFVASPEGGGPFRSRSRQDRHLCYVSPMGRGNARARAILPSAPCAPAGSQLEETIEEATISICGLRCELCIQGTYEDATSSDSRLGSLHCTTCGTEAPSLRGATATISVRGLRCEICRKGSYEETTDEDDRLGIFHCTTCGTAVPSRRSAGAGVGLD